MIRFPDGKVWVPDWKVSFLCGEVRGALHGQITENARPAKIAKNGCKKCAAKITNLLPILGKICKFWPKIDLFRPKIRHFLPEFGRFSAEFLPTLRGRAEIGRFCKNLRGHIVPGKNAGRRSSPLTPYISSLVWVAHGMYSVTLARAVTLQKMIFSAQISNHARQTGGKMMYSVLKF